MKGYLKTLTLKHTLDFETLIQGRNNAKVDVTLLKLYLQISGNVLKLWKIMSHQRVMASLLLFFKAASNDPFTAV